MIHLGRYTQNFYAPFVYGSAKFLSRTMCTKSTRDRPQAIDWQSKKILEAAEETKARCAKTIAEIYKNREAYISDPFPDEITITAKKVHKQNKTTVLPKNK